MTGCVCPGDTLTYECTATGQDGLTIWTGTAFECSFSNELVLLHSRFTSASGLCNNGDIVARGVSVEDNNYTSQLNVTVTSETAGKTIECFGVIGFNATSLIFSSVIPAITGLSPCMESQRQFLSDLLLSFVS